MFRILLSSLSLFVTIFSTQFQPNTLSPVFDSISTSCTLQSWNVLSFYLRSGTLAILVWTLLYDDNVHVETIVRDTLESSETSFAISEWHD